MSHNLYTNTTGKPIKHPITGQTIMPGQMYSEPTEVESEEPADTDPAETEPTDDEKKAAEKARKAAEKAEKDRQKAETDAATDENQTEQAKEDAGPSEQV